MSKWTEIESLRQKLVNIVKMEDRETRAIAGKYLERECRNLDEEYNILDSSFDDDSAVELRAIVQVIFDYILFDDLEDKDWQGALPTHFDGDVDDIMKQLKLHEIKKANNAS